MARARKQSKTTLDVSDIFSDSDFDADEFVEIMDEKLHQRARSGTNWRRLEQLREERMLRQELSDLDQWDGFDDADN